MFIKLYYVMLKSKISLRQPINYLVVIINKTLNFQGGVLPNIQAVLLPKKTETKVGTAKMKSQSQEY